MFVSDSRGRWGDRRPEVILGLSASRSSKLAQSLGRFGRAELGASVVLREGWTMKDTATNEMSVDSVELAAEAGNVVLCVVVGISWSGERELSLGSLYG